VKITLTCPAHGSWTADLKSHRSRSTCPAPGCKCRGVPRAGQFHEVASADVPARDLPERGNGVRLTDVDDATAELHPALRAMIRLLLSAASARHHLRSARPGGHLSGISAGPTQRGKTLAAAIVCRALGLDEVACIRPAGREAELSLWGRRAQEPGGRYVLTPSPVLALPFVALDELDKASGSLLRAALRLLQGDARLDAEGQPVDVAPTAYATSNAGLGVLPESYRRRSACLDTTGLPEVSAGTARRVLGQVPQLALGHLAPPATELPGPVLDRIEGALRACLTGLGWTLCDVRALELATLGRAAIAGDGDLPGAALRTVGDYLELAATTGQAHPGWMARLDAWASGRRGAELGQAAGPQGAEEQQSDDAYWNTAEAVGYAGAIGHRLARAVEDLAEAAELPGVPAGLLDEAAGVRQMAKQLVGPDLRKLRDVARLAEILPTAERVTQLAEDLANGMRAAAAGIIASEHQAEHEAALAAELHRRAQLQAAAQPAIERRAADRPPPPDPYEALARYRRSRRLASQPLASAVPASLFPLQPAWTVPASAPPAPARQPQRASSASSLTPRPAALAVRVTVPPDDTSVAEALTWLTQQRADAGLPPPTGSEIAQLYLPAAPR
jgi:hypothetical protein